MLVYVSRAEWGSTATTETFIANRFKASAGEKTTIQVHHTARIDSLDSTPNRWTYAAAESYMRQLQTVRPELGPLPYSVNLAASEDAQTVWVFEGRGVLTVGAHTAGHNRDGLGLGVFGNFDTKDEKAAAALVAAIETVCADLKNGTSPVAWLKPELPNLGTVLNPKGWVAWGHRDSSPKSCPGNTLYPLLEHFTLEEEPMSLPINKDSGVENIRHIQEMLGVTASGEWDFVDAVKGLADRSSTGDPVGKNGTHVNGRMYTRLLSEFIGRNSMGGGEFAKKVHGHVAVTTVK